jgi:hypothetical protein
MASSLPEGYYRLVKNDGSIKWLKPGTTGALQSEVNVELFLSMMLCFRHSTIKREVRENAIPKTNLSSQDRRKMECTLSKIMLETYCKVRVICSKLYGHKSNIANWTHGNTVRYTYLDPFGDLPVSNARPRADKTTIRFIGRNGEERNEFLDGQTVQSVIKKFCKFRPLRVINQHGQARKIAHYEMKMSLNAMTDVSYFTDCNPKRTKIYTKKVFTEWWIHDDIATVEYIKQLEMVSEVGRRIRDKMCNDLLLFYNDLIWSYFSCGIRTLFFPPHLLKWTPRTKSDDKVGIVEYHSKVDSRYKEAYKQIASKLPEDMTASILDMTFPVMDRYEVSNLQLRNDPEFLTFSDSEGFKDGLHLSRGPVITKLAN